MTSLAAAFADRVIKMPPAGHLYRMTSLRLVVVVVVGCGGSAPDVSPSDVSPPGGSFDSVERSEPVIDSVTTVRGFTQIPQSSSVPLVIAGKKLERTTSVAVGPFFLSLDSVAAHELRVTVFTNGRTPLGPLDVSVTSPSGTTVAPGALELTPIVVSPVASDGDGTFQSPKPLCDLEDGVGSDGTIVQLLAGTHRCGRLIQLTSGVTVQGDADQPTVVTGTDAGGFGLSVNFGNATSITTFRDLTFAAPLQVASISTFSGVGNLVVQRVADAGGISAVSDGLATIDHYTYEGEGTGIEVSFANITSSTVRHCGSGDGIVLSSFSGAGGLTMTGVVVEDCQRGLVMVGGRNELSSSIASCQFLDNRIGVRIANGFHSIRDTVIGNAPSQPGAAGMSMGSGVVFATGIQITGQDVGISIVQTDSFGPSAQLFGDGLAITGGRTGIEFFGIENSLSLRNSTVRDQTAASLLIASLDGPVDLGTPSAPGNNALSVVSGFAIDDQRRFNNLFDKYITATGTTLNGVSFDGETVDGPAELAPFYRIVDFDSGIQF